MTTPQFDLGLGARRRDHGHASVLSHFALETITLVVAEVARTKAEFTSEDVLDQLPDVTRSSLALSPNALGACIRAAAKAGIIEPTGRYIAAKRPEAHARKIAVWRQKT